MFWTLLGTHADFPVYYHTILLTFRPFLIFRGRWNQDTRAGQDSDKENTKREIPPWLNEACGYALSAACRTIHFLCESYTANDLVKVCQALRAEDRRPQLTRTGHSIPRFLLNKLLRCRRIRPNAREGSRLIPSPLGPRNLESSYEYETV